MHESTVVFINGLPGTGKTTFAKKLSSELQLPLISKDVIKEIIFDTAGWSDREWSKKVGRSAYALINYYLEEELKAGHSVILDSNSKPELHNGKFQALQEKYGYQSIEVLFKTEPNVLFERFKKRAENNDRHPGHADADNLEEWKQTFASAASTPLDLQGEIIAVDTTDFESVDYKNIITLIKSKL